MQSWHICVGGFLTRVSIGRKKVAWWHNGMPSSMPPKIPFLSKSRWHGGTTKRTSSFRHYSVIAFISCQMQRSFDTPLDGDPYGCLPNEEEDNGFSPAHFFFGDDEEEWEELEEVFLLLLFAMYMEERKIKWHH